MREVTLNQEIKDQYTKFISINYKIEELYHVVAEKMEFSDSAFKVMYGLCEAAHPCTQKEICERWSLNKQTVNSSIKKLVEQGVLKITPSENNFREKLVSFTEKAELTTKKTVFKIMEAEQAAFEKFTERERETAITLSEKQFGFMKDEFSKLVGEIK